MPSYYNNEEFFFGGFVYRLGDGSTKTT